MKKIVKRLRDEVKIIEVMEKKAKERLRHVPKGHLRIMKKRGKAQYYYRNADSTDVRECSYNGRYLRRDEIILAKRIAQRDYDMQFLNIVEKRRKAINNFVEIYEQTDLGEVYQKINPYRRELILPLALPDEEYIRRWQNVEYSRMGFEEGAPEYISEKGERVRSKSEKIIADKLYLLGIPYRYEYPLMLEGNIRKCPDFTILKMPERKEVYLEHLGMLDKTDYLEEVIYKWNTYEKNGIYLGINLFFTHETSKHPLNTRVLDEMIQKWFL